MKDQVSKLNFVALVSKLGICHAFFPVTNASPTKYHLFNPQMTAQKTEEISTIFSVKS